MNLDKTKRKLAALLPDKLYLRLAHYKHFGEIMDFGNPVTFNQKLHWLKVYDRNPLYIKLVDKYAVREWVAEKIGNQYLIPVLGVYDKFDEIPFEALPDKFVIKCTHDSGGLVLCKDKKSLDIAAAREKIEKHLTRNYFSIGREWAYKSVKPRIIVEQFMESPGDEGLIDYKFYCFNGEPRFLYISKGFSNHATASLSFYDLNWQELPFGRKDYAPYHNAVIPDNKEEMLKLAKKIGKEINNPFVRVDLYSIQGRIYFSEITLYPTSGYAPFNPKEWDKVLGSWIDLSKAYSKRKNV